MFVLQQISGINVVFYDCFFLPIVFRNARISSDMFATISVGMVNLLIAPDLTYMIGKTEDMEYHVKDKFPKEVLLCGSFGEFVAFSPSKMLVFV